MVSSYFTVLVSNLFCRTFGLYRTMVFLQINKKLVFYLTVSAGKIYNGMNK